MPTWIPPRTHPGYALFAGTQSTRVRPGQIPRRDFDPPPGGGIDLGSAPLLPAAHDAFTADELDARLALYAERAARREPVCTGGEPDYDDGRHQCWGCGDRPPPGCHAKSVGWWVRPFKYSGDSAAAGMSEIYCWRCAAEFGWNDRRPAS